MLSIDVVKENPEAVKETIKNKFQDDKLEIVDKAIEMDKKWRELKKQEDDLRAERNKVSKKIAELKKKGEDAEAEMEKAKEIPHKISDLHKKQEETLNERNLLLQKLPNFMSERTPIGKDDSENVVEKEYGKKPKLNFEVKPHSQIAEELGMADFESAAEISGSGFYFLEGDLALLNQALIQYAIDKMTSKGYRYVEAPLMLRNDIINRETDLTDQEEMIYRISNQDLSLIGTSEHSLMGRYFDKELNHKKLPIKQTSYSMCFRKEIGSHGLDEKGLFRTHQFNKVEMAAICLPEDSDKIYEEMKKITLEIFKDLELPRRVLKICSGDLGDLKKEQIDIEVYSPRQESYIEAGSCSNLTDAQARKLGISTRVKNERITPHTLNNTAVATSRALVAILENHQQKDGSVKIPSVKIPSVLQPYMKGKTKLVAEA